MKKLIYISFLCLLNFQVFAQNYSIEKNQMDDFVAAYAKEIIQTNTPSDSHHYTYSLTQKGNEFVVTCNVTPDNINVTERTDDVWNEMENTIVRAINRVKQSLAPIQPQPATTVTEQQVSQETFLQTVAPQNNTTITQMYPVSQQPHPQQQVSTQNYPQNNYQSQQPAKNNVNAYNNAQNPYGNMGYMQPQAFTIEDVRSGSATIGGKIWFNDGSFGVIFFLDGMGHGLAVSLDETETKWQNAKSERHCQDIYQLLNEGEPSKYCNGGLGASQTQMIINQLGWGQAPAAEWCLHHGNGWYLPSAGELWYLFAVANYQTANQDSGKKKSLNAKEGFISKMLQASGGQPLESYWYWSSSEEEQENAWNVSVSGNISSDDKTNEVAVRAVRYF